MTKVYVAKKYGNPPTEFNTRGVNGKLHMGMLWFGAQDEGLYFVLHDNSWRPFQARFKTTKFTEFFRKTSSVVTFGAAGAALGSVIPGAGNVMGAAIGAGVGAVGETLTENFFGAYLRYIG